MDKAFAGEGLCGADMQGIANRCGWVAACFAMLLSVSACETVPPLRTDDSGFPQGTVMLLNAPVAIAPGRVSAILRGGSIGSIDQYEANCRLEVNTIRNAPFTVEADAFIVSGVYRDWDTLTGPPIPFPTIGGSFYSVGDGPGLIYFNTYIYLESVQQPDVSRLKCWQLQESDWNPHHLSYEDIRTVLGDTVTISRPGQEPDVDLRFKGQRNGLK